MVKSWDSLSYSPIRQLGESCVFYTAKVGNIKKKQNITQISLFGYNMNFMCNSFVA